MNDQECGICGKVIQECECPELLPGEFVKQVKQGLKEADSGELSGYEFDEKEGKDI